MTTAASLARSVLGSDARLRPVGGGDINVAFRAETPDGPVFIKCHPDPPAGMFEAEASGLRALRRHAPADLGVPEVRRVHPHGLVLEWIEPARPSATTDAGFGRDLAALHRATSDAFGGIDGSTGGYLGLPASTSRQEPTGLTPTFGIGWSRWCVRPSGPTGWRRTR